MLELTGAQLKPLAKLLFSADKRGFTLKIDQAFPRGVVSLWMGDGSRLWAEVSPEGKIEFSKEV